MKVRNYFRFVAIAIVIAAVAVLSHAQTGDDGKLASMTVGGNSVRWDISVPNSGGSVLVSFPDGRSFRKAFRAGGAPVIDLSDKRLDGLPEGVYNYELRLSPALTGGQKEAMMKARGNDDDPEAERAGRKRPAVPALVQHGSFSVINGALVGPGAIEGGGRTASNTAPQQIKKPATPARVSANTVTRLRNHRFSLGAMPDEVIPDDLIVQGSACVGFDCVNGESFGFDTIRVKENNTRIQFDDTSGAGFPTNNWQIRANSSAGGGASFLAFVDQGASGNSETGTIVFEVDAGAPANSLRVSSIGRVGIRTATPSLDMHINSSDTPDMRLEQTNSGGFAAQTWDIAGNEANFFVRDVTSGSRLPFRIRPGAPTSSIDIAASGNVGIGTASPAARADILSTATGTHALLSTMKNDNAGFWGGVFFNRTTANAVRTEVDIAGDIYAAIFTGGSVGIGTSAPTQLLSVNGDADKVGGGSWGVFSDARLKEIKGRYTTGLSAVMGLHPLRYSYKKDNALGIASEGEYVGFSAQELQKLVPDAVTTAANGYLMVHNDPILWTMLNAIKEQQKEIEQLKGQIKKLQVAQRRPRR